MGTDTVGRRGVEAGPEASPRMGAAERFGAAGEWLARAGATLQSPWAVAGVVVAMGLAMGWQFIADASRAVPALDTAWYQWRAELLRAGEPGALIAIKGAQGALAGGYRVAEPVLAVLVRGVGGVGPETPTVLLSVLLRVLAAVGLAAFAWRHRRSWLLFYLTLVVVPAVFLLQQFFGFMDNFLALTLTAGTLLLMDRLRTSWTARLAAFALMVLSGLSHPTTLALFLLSIGAVAGYRLLRDRSLRSVLASDLMPVLWVGAASSVAVGATWLGGLWGPSAGFGEAAVPPPQDLDFFVKRSLSVLRGMYPWILIPVGLLGLGTLTASALARRDRFAEITVAWNLPLLGTLGFLVGAAYPYFRFFNATLAPLLAIAAGFAALIALALRPRARPLAQAAPVVVSGFVVVVLGLWWATGLSSWNGKGTWLTPEVRETMAAAEAYLDAQPEGTRAVFLVDEKPGKRVVYSRYKEFANAIYAGVDGEWVRDTYLFFGRAEDLRAGRASSGGNAQYEGIARDTADEALPVLRSEPGATVVLLPLIFNEGSPNAAFAEECAGCERLAESGLLVVPELSGAPVSEEAVAAARRAAAEARAFSQDPPGPLSDAGGALLALLRLGLLLVVPGWLLYRGLAGREWLEGLALVPILSIGATTAVGVVVAAVLRQPFTAPVGWATWGVAVALGLAAAALPVRRGRERSRGH